MQITMENIKAVARQIMDLETMSDVASIRECEDAYERFYGLCEARGMPVKDATILLEGLRDQETNDTFLRNELIVAQLNLNEAKVMLEAAGGRCTDLAQYILINQAITETENLIKKVSQVLNELGNGYTN